MSEAVLLMRETFDALRTGASQNQPRRRLAMPSGSVLHAMAGAHGKYFGTKIYSTNAKYGSMHFLFWLLDAETANPCALMEANWLGQIRTGAASGYATDLLARKDATTLGIIGSGFQARSQVEAVSAVRPLKEIRVWSRNEANRAKFAADCAKDFGLNVRAVSTAREAVEDMDIVATATWSKDPVLQADWIAPGTHINAMGSNHPQRRELPAELIAKVDWIACDSIEQSRIESGDLLLAWTEADWKTPRLIELKDADERTNAPEITVFKSNGLGVEDVAAGAFVYEQALKLGVGRPLYSGAES